LIGFRNILAHNYLDLDREVIYRVLQDDLEDTQTLQRAFAQLL
jgi:uncharacterized protein YutE (UPF0331/DUF86 family)